MANGEEGQQEEGQREEPTPEPESSQGEDTIPRSSLPEEMRDLPPERIEQTTRLLLEQLQDYRQREEEGELGTQHAGQRGREEAREERRFQSRELDEEEREELRDLVLDDPQAAMDRYFEARFGAGPEEIAERLDEVGDLASRGARAGAFVQAERQLPEFEKYEDQIRQTLNEAGAAPTMQNIEGAYYMARGRESVQTQQSRAAQAHESEKPSEPEGGEEEPQLTRVEEKVRRDMGVSRERYLEIKEEGSVQVDVPGVD